MGVVRARVFFASSPLRVVLRRSSLPFILFILNSLLALLFFGFVVVSDDVCCMYYLFLMSVR